MKPIVINKLNLRLIHLKCKLRNYVDDNSKIELSIDKIIWFFKTKWLIISKDLEQYEHGSFNKQRVIIITSFRIMCMLTFFRYLVSCIYETRPIIKLTSNSFYLLGNGKLISLGVSMAIMCVIALSTIIQFQETTHTFKILSFFYEYKRRPDLRLKDGRRLALKINFMAKLLFYRTYWCMVLVIFIQKFGIDIYEYLNSDYGYYILSIIIWDAIELGTIIQLFSIINGGFLLSAFCALYLKYRFREIVNRIEQSLRRKNKIHFKRAIIEHDKATR